MVRRRLLVARAAGQLAHGYTTADVAAGTGHGPTAASSRAFARAHGSSPSRHSGTFALTGHHLFLSQPEAVADLVVAVRLTLTGPDWRSQPGPALDLATFGPLPRRRSLTRALGGGARVSTPPGQGWKITTSTGRAERCASRAWAGAALAGPAVGRLAVWASS